MRKTNLQEYGVGFERMLETVNNIYENARNSVCGYKGKKYEIGLDAKALPCKHENEGMEL